MLATAGNRTDDRRRERAEPHVSLRHSGNDRRFEIPNACNVCHADKSTAWATAALKTWRTAHRGV